MSGLTRTYIGGYKSLVHTGSSEALTLTCCERLSTIISSQQFVAYADSKIDSLRSDSSLTPIKPGYFCLDQEPTSRN